MLIKNRASGHQQSVTKEQWEQFKLSGLDKRFKVIDFEDKPAMIKAQTPPEAQDLIKKEIGRKKFTDKTEDGEDISKPK